MRISTDFSGGNACFEILNDGFVHVAPDLRDTMTDWFYWAFRVEAQPGQTVTFDFTPKKWVGPFGPAVSRDARHWEWLGTDNLSRFTYTFEDDKPVYFAHDMLYQAERFAELSEELALPVETLCETSQGTPVPCFRFGTGDRWIMLTARHHCCESTGSYVLEGILRELYPDGIPGYSFFVVPMVDYDGVRRGDQGKNRAPHDNNRDYLEEPVYPANRAIMNFCRTHDMAHVFDFHSPWHIGGRNDHVFFVEKTTFPHEAYIGFGEILQKSLRPGALKYDVHQNMPAETDWNTSAGMKGCLSEFEATLPGLELSFSLETTYFGTAYNKVSQSGLIELGRSFTDALKIYLAK